jgi:parallel beta-helix repeat protein
MADEEVAMKKSFSKIFLAVILVGSLVLASGFHLDVAKASQSVGGIKSSNDTWTNANGPYNLTGNVLINEGVTITVEAGNVINFNGHYIRVNGTLILQPGVTVNFASGGGSIQVNGVLSAPGTSANPIRINGEASYYAMFAPSSYSPITFSKTSTGWNEATASGSIIENAVLNYTTIETSTSIKISNNIINSGEISVLGGSPVISYNSVSSFIHIEGGNCLISNNQITNGFILYSNDNGGEGATIINNVISHAQSVSGTKDGIWFSGESVGHVLVQNNLISDNYFGIQILSPNVSNMPTTLTIQDNTISNNNVGISVSNSYTPTITGNNLLNNNVSIQLATDYSSHSKDIIASDNWRGTTDTSAIDKLIYDFYDDFNLGKVTYTPFLTSANPNAAPDLNALPPIPTSSPSTLPTEAPTSNSTSMPTLNPTTTPSLQNPTSTPDQLSSRANILFDFDWGEVAIIAVLCVIAVLLFVNILFRNRKK